MNIDQASQDVRQALFVAVPGSTFWKTDAYREYVELEIPLFEQSCQRILTIRDRENSKREQKKAQHDMARTVTCPTCGQPPGWNCRAASGQHLSAMYDHVARIRAAEVLRHEQA